MEFDDDSNIHSTLCGQSVVGSVRRLWARVVRGIMLDGSSNAVLQRGNPQGQHVGGVCLQDVRSREVGKKLKPDFYSKSDIKHSLGRRDDLEAETAVALVHRTHAADAQILLHDRERVLVAAFSAMRIQITSAYGHNTSHYTTQQKHHKNQKLQTKRRRLIN